MQKEQKLEVILKSLGGVVVAFSGGVDSTYLLKKAMDVLGSDRVLAVTADSETYPKRELEEAKKLAKEMGATHLVIHTSELAIENFSSNPPDRCYYCKKELFGTLTAIAKGEGLTYVLDGSNYDDLKDHRPGSQAAAELGIRSPLKEAEMTKEDIRMCSKALNLPTWSKPAFACLSSRFPYGQEITKDKLKQVAAAEDCLRELGFTQVRVRHHGSVARIEVFPEERERVLQNADKIQQAFKKAGFKYSALDLMGYRQGSMNE